MARWDWYIEVSVFYKNLRVNSALAVPTNGLLLFPVTVCVLCNHSWNGIFPPLFLVHPAAGRPLAISQAPIHFSVYLSDLKGQSRRLWITSCPDNYTEARWQDWLCQLLTAEEGALRPGD